MKIEEILSVYEDKNTKYIVIMKENLFYRVYNRSCLRFIEHFRTFRVFKKHIKMLNRDICYLGFPAKAYETLAKACHFPKPLKEDDNVIVLGDYIEKQNYLEWFNKLEYATKKEKKVQKRQMTEAEEDLLKLFSVAPDKPFSVKDFSKSYEHTSDLLEQKIRPISESSNAYKVYKLAGDITVQLYALTHSWSREYKYSEGQRLREDAFSIYRAAYHNALIAEGVNLVSVSDMPPINILMIQQFIYDIRLRIRLMLQLRIISHNSFTNLNAQLEKLLQMVNTN